MVNLFAAVDLECLLMPSLQPRHFLEIDLSKRQLQIWSNKAGLAATHRDNPRTRRNYSPLEVLVLFVLKSLRKRVNPHIVEEEFLLRFLSNEEKFLFPLMQEWLSGATPFLVTDFSHMIWLTSIHDGKVTVPAQLDGTVSVAMALCEPVELALLALSRGGNDQQREFGLLAKGYRAARLQMPVQNTVEQTETSSEEDKAGPRQRAVRFK